MTNQELTRAAELAKAAGDFDLADKLELAATQATREAAEFRVLARETAWEQYGTVYDGEDY